MRKWLLPIIVVVLLVAVYVTVAMPPVVYADSGNFTATTDDTGFHLVNTPYATAWNATTFPLIPPLSGYNDPPYIGQHYSVYYTIGRAVVYFDTSSIPSLASITSANLSLYMLPPDDSDTDYNVTIQSGMPTYPHLPFVDSDVNRLYYSGDGGSINTSGLSVNSYFNISLNATGISWINKGGYTKFMLRSSKDIAGTAPTGTEMITIASRDTGSAVAPILYLVWEATAAPTVTTNPATYVTSTSARLNSYLNSDGGEACEIRFEYDIDSGAPYDYATDWIDGYYTGNSPYANLVDLDYNTEYFFRVQAKNSQGTTDGAELSFTTSATPDAPTSVELSPSACYINLSWVKGDGAEYTVVRYQTGSCPSTNISGTEVYNGTSNSYVHTDLSPGTTYYYQLWGWSGGNYSASGSGCYLTTTLAGSCETTIPDEPETPDTWWGAPNYERWDGLPWYNLINSLCDTVSLPYATGWMLMMIFFIVVTGLLAYALSHNLALAGGLVLIFTILGAVFELLPLWIAIVFGVTALGFCWKEFR